MAEYGACPFSGGIEKMSERRRTLNSFLPRCLIIVAVAGAGCRCHDLVEAELRSRERDVQYLRCELHRLEDENQALAHELGGARHEGGVPIPTELTGQTYTVKKITLGRLTGGYSADGVSGDAALRVIVEPRDSDNHSVKVPGSVQVEALEITPEGLKTHLATWNVDAHQLRRTWQSGLFTTGYVLLLPWRNRPASDKLRVVARLRLGDGRVFEADRDITVRLTGKGPREAPPPTPPEGPAFPLPKDDESLPLPRKASAGTWQRPINENLLDRSDASAVKPVAWAPSQTPDLSQAVRMLKPVPQTSEEWPPR
jgi:hypothetical protein